MATTTGSVFWPVLIACVGGILVLVGLLMEALAEKKWFKDAKSQRCWQSRRRWGEWILIGGIVIEVIVAGHTAFSEWQNRPEKRPVRTISAHVNLLVKGDKYVREPISDPHWAASISFMAGTNLAGSNTMFLLSATLADVAMVNILGTNRTDREYSINFNRGHFERISEDDPGFGKPADSFNSIKSLVLSIPQFEIPKDRDDIMCFLTNKDEVITGDVEVTINAALVWKFSIPAQTHRYGVITSRNIENNNGIQRQEVMPVPLRDWISPERFTNLVYDGK